MFLSASLSLAVKGLTFGCCAVCILDAGRCLLKIYVNGRRKKPWCHKLFDDKLFVKKLLFLIRRSRGISLSIPADSNAPISVDDSKVAESTEDLHVSRLRRTEVLFFPDHGFPCRDFYSSPSGCDNVFCSFMHGETAYSRLLSILDSAKSSIDVCVFCFTCADLGTALMTKSKTEGVRVRVITDSEQINVSGSQVGRLRREGFKVRHDNSSYLMHHKFVVVDGELLINGSFNWTRTAITGNHENLVISRDQEMVRPFVSRFQKIWDSFDPDKQIGFEQKPVRPTW